MSTFRIATRRQFVRLDSRAVNDPQLSFRARGVLAWLLDKPDDWRCNSLTISKAGKEGRDAVRTALRELAEAGYLERHAFRDAEGRWATEWVVYEHPSLAVAGPENPSRTGPENPASETRRREVRPSTHDSPLTTQNTPPSPPEGGEHVEVDESFVRFWAMYPRKEKKAAAERAWAKAMKVTTAEVVLAGLERRLPIWERADRQFIPHPTSWLNAGRWEDELDPGPDRELDDGTGPARPGRRAGDPDCNQCGGSGWTLDENGDANAQPCPCRTHSRDDAQCA